MKMDNKFPEGYTHLTGDTGVVLSKVPQNILDKIKPTVQSIQNNFQNSISYGNILAGQIDKEYEAQLSPEVSKFLLELVELYSKFNPKTLQNYLSPIIKSFHHEYSYNPLQHIIYEGDCWINFQKKYEYNPIHKHSGVFSYVIWYKIPYYKDNEIKHGAGKNKLPEQNVNGDFQFICHNGDDITSINLDIDNKREGYVAIFPSNLLHTVYPFYTSDDYRITISGNMFLKI